RHLTRVGVIATPAAGSHAKCGKLEGRLGEIPLSGRQSHPNAVLGKSHDVRHSVAIHIRDLARVGVIAAPTAGARTEGRYAESSRSEVQAFGVGRDAQCRGLS